MTTNIAGNTIKNRLQVSNDMAKYYAERSEEYKNQAGSYAVTATQQASIATAATSEVVTKGDNAITSIGTATTEALTEIEQSKINSLSNISNTANTCISDINFAGNTNLINLQNETLIAKDYAQKAIGWDIEYDDNTLVFTDRTNDEISTALNYIEDAKDDALTELGNFVQTSENTAINNINATTSGVVDSVQTAGNNAVSSINSAKDNTVSNINSAVINGTTQINSSTNNVINNIRSVGNNTINSVYQAGARASSDAMQYAEISKEYSERATFGWDITYNNECLTFTNLGGN